MQALFARLDKQLGLGWRDVVEWLRAINSLDDIERAIRTGRMRDVVQGVADAADRFAADTHAAYVSAAQRAKEWLDGAIDDELISFNADNPRAVRWAQQNRYELRGAVTNEQQTAIHQAVSRGVREGLNPRDIAREVRDSIGLTPYQESIVANYRRELEQGDYTAALARELRDRRHDRSMHAAIAGRRTFDDDDIDRMVETYRQGWIDYRAETIARTEALRAAHQGTEELYSQALERGQLSADELVRTWRAGPKTPEARDGHQALDGLEQPIGGVFTNPFTGERLRYPGDPEAPVSETANCRCVVTVRYKPRPANAPQHPSAVL